ncbi:hypothetical protein Y032_0093g2645 [Ancylostoma ceylanicum]|uniref:Uncharacterized protein n=1 Tax=Ancylostoma ceylanicum TaxID=53326 RepID=A0A016TM13_9BILA|nr:hypothetical protein Y032_0093g2645 [Ancylostoma ceylanicum]
MWWWTVSSMRSDRRFKPSTGCVGRTDCDCAGCPFNRHRRSTGVCEDRRAKDMAGRWTVLLSSVGSSKFSAQKTSKTLFMSVR